MNKILLIKMSLKQVCGFMFGAIFTYFFVRVSSPVEIVSKMICVLFLMIIVLILFLWHSYYILNQIGEMTALANSSAPSALNPSKVRKFVYTQKYITDYFNRI